MSWGLRMGFLFLGESRSSFLDWARMNREAWRGNGGEERWIGGRTCHSGHGANGRRRICGERGASRYSGDRGRTTYVGVVGHSEITTVQIHSCTSCGSERVGDAAGMRATRRNERHDLEDCHWPGLIIVLHYLPNLYSTSIDVADAFPRALVQISAHSVTTMVLGRMIVGLGTFQYTSRRPY